MSCEDVNWIPLAQGSVQCQVFCEHGNEPLGSIKAANLCQLKMNFLHHGVGRRLTQPS